MAKEEKIGAVNNRFFLQKLADFLSIPAGSIANVTHMEVEGNTQIRIENCGVILKYQPQEIQIRTGKITTKFTGTDLFIKCLNSSVMEICGIVSAIEFLR